MDLVCVAPCFIERDTDFLCQLFEKLCQTPDVQNCSCRKEAKIPIITLLFNSQAIDIGLANLDSETVPHNIENYIPDDMIASLEEKSRASLGGRRDNMKILQAVMQVNQLENFQISVKAIKLWTKAKGISDNKLGYFGGIVYSIMLAKICQMFPLHSVNLILEEFFKIYSVWDWEYPVMIEQLREDKEGPLQSLCSLQWGFTKDQVARVEPMVILTPAFPSYNTMKATNQTFRCIKDMLRESNNLIQNEIKKGLK